MGSNRKNRMPADQVQANIDAYLALKAMPGYKPYNPAFSLEAITACVELLRTAEVNDLHTEHARLAARDAIVAAQWAQQSQPPHVEVEDGIQQREHALEIVVIRAFDGYV